MVNVSDSLVIAGFALLTIGLAIWSIPLALVADGVLLLAAGLWSHYSHGDNPGTSVPPPPADSNE